MPKIKQDLSSSQDSSKRSSLKALDVLCTVSADIGAGTGSYLGAYLRSVRNWDSAAVGVALSVVGIAGTLSQIPAGQVIDKVRNKRLIVAIAAAVLGLSCLAIAIYPRFLVVIAAQLLCGAAGNFLGPTIVAITLGLVGLKRFASRAGRNEAFIHLGNFMAAGCAAAGGYYFSREWIFYLVAILAVGTICTVFFIKEDDIDNVLAKGIQASDVAAVTDRSYAHLFTDKRLLALACTALFFNLSNGSMLPLAGQFLSEGKAREATAYVSGCIGAAQFMMIPTSIFAGKFADKWGRKPVLLTGLAILPIRALLYTLTNQPVYFFAIQLLDGIGAAIFSILTTVIVADLTRGTGHYNLARGFVGTLQCLGAATSFILVGNIVKSQGYHAGFYLLSALGAMALAIFAFFVPETRPRSA